MNSGSISFRYPRHFLRLSAGIVAVFALSVLTTHISGSGEIKPKTTSLAILYTSQADGQIRSCNCTKIIWGGYGRMATLVEQIKGEQPHLMLVEGGGMVRSAAGQERLKSEVAMRSMEALGYTAAVPGKAEISFGLEALKQLSPGSRVPFVLANVTYAGTDEAIADKRYTVSDIGGIRVATVGLLGSEIISTSLDMGLGVDVAEPTEILKKLAPEIRKKADLILVVSHSSIEQARRLAESGLADIVLCTYSGDRPPMPKSPTDTLLEMPSEKIGDTVLVVSRTRMCWSLGRLDVELDGKKIKSCGNRLYYLGRQYEDHASILPIYADYNTKVRGLVSAQAAEMRKTLEEIWKKRGMEPPPRASTSPFAEAESCKECHEEAYKAWKQTRHAKAFASLKKTNQEFDPECIACHVTGANVRGGFTSYEDTPELSNVQCEACHGPGLAHVKKPAAGYGNLQEELCRGCHTAEFNPDFDYGEMMKKITHK